MQVVVEQPRHCRVAVGGGIGGGQCPGVLADQVMQAVAPARRLGEQVLVVEALKVAPGVPQAGAVQGSRGVAVGIGAREQAQPAEQPLLAGSEIVVGQVESGRDGQVLGVHQLQPVAGRCQVGREPGDGPGGVVMQLAASIPTASGRYPHRRTISRTGPSSGLSPGRPASRSSIAAASASGRTSRLIA